MPRFGLCFRTCLMAVLTSVAVAACATTQTTRTPLPPVPAIYERTTTVAFQRVPGLDCCSLEFPAAGWTTTPGQDLALVTLQHNQGQAHVTLEETELGVSLDPTEITTVFSNIEMDIIRERHPEASEFDSTIITDTTIPIVVTHYRQTDAGAREKVRQYSFPRGKKLYRLICTAAESNFLRYEQIFAHIAASFQAETET